MNAGTTTERPPIALMATLKTYNNRRNAEFMLCK